MTINVYEQYFEAEAQFSGVPRKGALVMLISDSEAGHISYKAAVNFFPHADDEDYAVSYDAYFEKTLFDGKGRRSKKREAAFMEGLQADIDDLAAEEGAKVFWDKPLRNARLG